MNLKKRMAQFMNKTSLALRGKRGSSLGMVMAIGAALVIWVMAIMPLMTTTGVVALNTAETEQDYLDSRSSIEFAKSELSKIAETEIPYTFAVIKEVVLGDYRYSAIKKLNSAGGVDPAYSKYAKDDLNEDDTYDVPVETADGKMVAAICAVVKTSSTLYDITITTYNDGDKGFVYKATYKANGSLLIYPESYQKNQALPLSDFVLVDGKLGSNEVWTSNITSAGVGGYTGYFQSNNFVSAFKEELRPWKVNAEATYANAGEYPVLFKVPAEASSTSLGMSPITNNIEPLVWIKLKDGDVLVGEDGETLSTAGQLSNYNLDRAACTLYYNGVATKPTLPGTYVVTMDFAGTGAYNATQKNILPAQGLVVGTYTISNPTQQSTALGTCRLTGINGNVVTISAENANVATLYGYSIDPTGREIVWKQGNEITLPNVEQPYYFYCYQPDHYIANSGTVVKGTNQVVYVGMLATLSALNNPETGSYWLASGYPDASDNTKTNWYGLTGNTAKSTLGVTNISSLVDVERALLLYNSADTALVWDVTRADANSSNVTISKKEGNTLYYLRMTQQEKYNAGKIRYDYTYGLAFSTSTSNSVFRLDGNIGSLSQKFTEKYIDWGIKTRETNPKYFTIGPAEASIGENSSIIYYVKVPVAGDATNAVAPTFSVANPFAWTVQYGVNSDATVIREQVVNSLQTLASTANVGDIYINTTALSNGLHAGTYVVRANVTINNVTYYGINVGTLTIDKATGALNGELSIRKDDNDENKVHVKYVDANVVNTGTKYFGYRLADSTLDYYWMEVNENETTFEVDYGTYEYIIVSSGVTDYTNDSKVSEEFLQIVPPPVVITYADDKAQFYYSLNKQNGEVVWFKLPKENEDWKIKPSRISMRYGKDAGDGTIDWAPAYSSGVVYYGAVIMNATYENPEAVYQDGDETIFLLSSPLPISAANEHYSSVLKASSMYFMGYGDKGECINTWGNTISLTADLVVLNGDIINGGQIYIKPYSTGDNKPNNTLLFCTKDISINGVAVFKARQFYKIPADTNLADTAALLANLNSMKCEETTVVNGETKFPDSIKNMFLFGTYPDVDLDIAYANKTQLASIISSETIGWTTDGMLAKEDGTRNSKYVVCVYVEAITGDVDVSANRILLTAAPGADKAKVLNVGHNVNFRTRYMSLDADQIAQLNSDNSFILYNLGKDDNYLEEIAKALDISSYYSKTFQVDYERDTTIISKTAETVTHAAQIYRYDGDADGKIYLFKGDAPQALISPYSAKEISNMFGDSWGSLALKETRIVERYMSIANSDNKSSAVEAWALFSCLLDIYTNYIYVAPDVTTISMYSWVYNDIRINSQENGYSSTEYLWFFTSNSTEYYSGTLMYFNGAKKVRVKEGLFKDWKEYTMPGGFYFIPAVEGGTSFIDVAIDVDKYYKDNNPNTNSKYCVDQDDLKNYAVFVDADGNIRDAFVDTGISDSNSANIIGGFSGGSVQ